MIVEWKLGKAPFGFERAAKVLHSFFQTNSASSEHLHPGGALESFWSVAIWVCVRTCASVCFLCCDCLAPEGAIQRGVVMARKSCVQCSACCMIRECVSAFLLPQAVISNACLKKAHSLDRLTDLQPQPFPSANYLCGCAVDFFSFLLNSKAVALLSF